MLLFDYSVCCRWVRVAISGGGMGKGIEENALAGPPTSCVPPGASILHRSEGAGAISLGRGKGTDGVVVGVEVGLDCQSWPLVIVVVGL